MPLAAFAVPLTVNVLRPRTPRMGVGTSAEKWTDAVTVPFDRVTLALTRFRVNPVLPAISALKIFSASVTPAAIEPSLDIAAAAAMAGDAFATEPTLAASAAA